MKRVLFTILLALIFMISFVNAQDDFCAVIDCAPGFECIAGGCIEILGIEVCEDTDGGVDYYTEGSVTFSTGDIIYFDSCIDENTLEERFCGGDVFTTSYECPNGCEDGACIENPCAVIDCAPGFECFGGECINLDPIDEDKKTFCKDSDGGIVLDVQGELVLKVEGKNAITAKDTCAYDNSPEDPNGIRYIETKGCDPGKNCYVQELSCEGFEGNVEKDYSEPFNCFNGCKNGACIPDEKPNSEKRGYRYASWECYDGESFKSEDDTSCKLPETWEKYAKEFCEDKCVESNGEKKCGVNSYSINKECYYGDKEIIIEEKKEYKDSDNIEKAEIINDISVCKNSCPFDNKCYPFGYRKSGEFCSDIGSFVSQLDSEKSCDNNFECSSNLCVDSLCVDSGLWQRFLKWLDRFFG